jgi:hypothetical protein
MPKPSHFHSFLLQPFVLFRPESHSVSALSTAATICCELTPHRSLLFCSLLTTRATRPRSASSWQMRWDRQRKAWFENIAPQDFAVRMSPRLVRYRIEMAVMAASTKNDSGIQVNVGE